MCLFTNARTVAIVFARSAGGEAMYCAGGLTVDGGFMDSSSSRTKCISERLKSSRRGQGSSPVTLCALFHHAKAWSFHPFFSRGVKPLRKSGGYGKTRSCPDTRLPITRETPLRG